MSSSQEFEMDLRAGSMSDFVVRRRRPTLVTLAVVTLATLAGSLALAFLVTSKTLLALSLAMLIGAASWYAIYAIQQTQDLLMATEFQNALFSSAIGISHKFCLILKHNGTITYLDRAFQDMFPNFFSQPHRTIDVWLNQSKVAPEEKDEIIQAVAKGGFSKIICVMRTPGEGYYKLVISVEPIVKPQGFVLLRGREFIENRSSAGSPDVFQKFDTLNRSFISLFSQVVGTMNMGVCMTGPVGNILYANGVIEKWLGFSDGEIVSCGFKLQDIIQYDREGHDLAEPEDLEVPVHLQMKHGGIMRVFLSQRVIRDEKKKVLGCVALLHSLTSNPIPMKPV